MILSHKNSSKDTRKLAKVSLRKKEFLWSIVLTTYGLSNQQLQIKVEELKSSMNLAKSWGLLVQDSATPIGLCKSILSAHFSIKVASLTLECGHWSPVKLRYISIPMATLELHLMIMISTTKITISIWLITVCSNMERIMGSLRMEIL